MPLAVAGNCKRKYAETQSAFPSATATRANEGPGACLARRRAFRPNPCLSRVLARSLFGLEMQAQDTSSPSVLSADQTVFYVEEGREELIAIPVGAFADPCFPAPTISVYEEYMHPWVSLPDNIEHS